MRETARANGVRFRTDERAATVRYHAGDVRRVAPLVTATPRPPVRHTGLAGCLVLLSLLAGLVALAIWAWCQGPGSSHPGYWH